MRRIAATLIVILLACDHDPMWLAPGRCAAELLQNPGFEDVMPGDETAAQYWLSGSALDGDELVVTDLSQARSGSRYMRLQSDSHRGPEAEEATIQLNTMTGYNEILDRMVWAVQAGDSVRFGGWAYRETGNLPLRFSLWYYDAGRQSLPDDGVSTPQVTEGVWTFAETTVVVPVTAAFMQFFPEVFNTYPPAAGSVHTVGRFDDVFLHIVAPCSQLEVKVVRAHRGQSRG